MVERLPSVREARFNSQHCLRKRVYLTSARTADMIAEEGGGWRGKRGGRGGGRVPSG